MEKRTIASGIEMRTLVTCLPIASLEHPLFGRTNRFANQLGSSRELSDKSLVLRVPMLNMWQVLRAFYHRRMGSPRHVNYQVYNGRLCYLAYIENSQFSPCLESQGLRSIHSILQSTIWCIQATCYRVYQPSDFQGCAIAVYMPQAAESICMDNFILGPNTVASSPTWPKGDNIFC
ncbi:hypothetical protein BDV36DRAFT_100289 [Aspergillus pseudocaelatus]|uniref:Uncharacterized protein n=1 Tax=Aspergillus pseudocaelatus TaxID=1825620 RepID=A0ABQ6WWI3_9EURO|nr:hypothetical protein BDV36DRAFT_100289 [Aspergillus pseudocaelatus]